MVIKSNNFRQFLFLASLFMLVGCGNPQQSLERGRAYLKNKEYEKAINEFDKAIQVKANFDTAYFERANAKLKASLRVEQGKPVYTSAKESLIDYDRAISLNPDYEEAYEQRAFARQQLLDIKGAFEDYSTAIALSPNKFSNYYFRGAIELNSKQFETALDDLNKAITLYSVFSGKSVFPKAELFCTRGIVRYELGMNQEAMQDFNESYKSDSSWDDAMLWMGFCKLRLNDTIGGCVIWREMKEAGNSEAQSLLQTYCD